MKLDEVLVKSWIDKSNKDPSAFYLEMAADDIKMRTMEIATGRYVDILGKHEVMKLITTESPSDMIFVPERILIDNNRVCIFGYNTGHFLQTSLGSVRVEDSFKFNAIVYAEMEDDELKYIEFSYDTFEAMKVCGSAILKEDNPAQVKAYLENILDLGFISEKIIKDGIIQ